MTDHNKSAQAIANTHLIDAAPELLEACKRALRFVLYYQEMEPESEERRAFHEELEALIAKATGHLQSPNDVHIGQCYRVYRLGATTGFSVAEKHVACRREGIVVVKQIVPGHGGDVWFCEHANGDIAAYCFTELQED